MTETIVERQESPKLLRIIAQTAFTLSGDMETSLAKGCNDAISKPLIESDLMATISKHLKK
ncbi:MAG: hypothetical protein WCI48_05375 [Bacteroidota bacterium]|jgi:CheY-like chemotaxis protein